MTDTEPNHPFANPRYLLHYFGIYAYLYSFYLIFLGTEKVHRLDTTKSAISTLIAILVTTAIIIFVLGEGRIRHPIL